MSMVSTTGLHAIRAMTYLAMQPPGTKVGASAIAQEIKAPKNYLGKLLQTLANAGLLDSQKGHGGGFSLSRPAKKISLFHVLDVIENVGDEPDCFFGWKKCSDTKPCALHTQWKKARTTLHETLKKSTLDQVSKGEIFE